MSDPAGVPPVRPIWRDPVVIATAIIWIGFLFGLRTIHRTQTTPDVAVAAGDVIALPGEEVELVAQVERRRPSGAIERAGIEVGLHRSEEEEGSGAVKTEIDGIARRTVVAPEEPGAHMFVVRVSEPHIPSPRILFDPRLFVLEPGSPIVVVDLEGTLLPIGSDELGAISPSTVGALSAIAVGRTVVFLHAGDPAITDRLRGALPLANHSRAPIVAGRRPGETTADYRGRQLGEWSRYGISSAIVGSAAACASFVAAGIDTILLGDTACAGATRVEGWAGVREKFREEETPNR